MTRMPKSILQKQPVYLSKCKLAEGQAAPQLPARDAEEVKGAGGVELEAGGERPEIHLVSQATTRYDLALVKP